MLCFFQAAFFAVGGIGISYDLSRFLERKVVCLIFQVRILFRLGQRKPRKFSNFSSRVLYWIFRSERLIFGLFIFSVIFLKHRKNKK